MTAPVDVKHRILIVEDEPTLAESLKYALEVEGFDHTTIDDVRSEIPPLEAETSASLREWRLRGPEPDSEITDRDVERIVDVPMYALDPVVRRSDPLQQTHDNPPAAVRVNANQA